MNIQDLEIIKWILIFYNIHQIIVKSW